MKLLKDFGANVALNWAFFAWFLCLIISLFTIVLVRPYDLFLFFFNGLLSGSSCILFFNFVFAR